MTEEAGGSVTRWIGHLRRGDGHGDAARALWDRYFGRLVRLARARIRSAPAPGGDDEEDVALSAFDSVVRGIGRGQIGGVAGRDELWRLMAVIAGRKAINRVKREGRLKRGGGRVLPEADLAAADGGGAGLDRLAGRELPPDLAALVAEESRRLLDLLGDPTLRQIAVWRTEGLTNEEVAARLDCSLRTVANKVTLIRQKWEREGS